jgi:hypothetical protein
LLRRARIGADAVARLGERLALADEVKLRLFDDVEVALKVEERMPTCMGSRAYLCSVEGDAGTCGAVVLERNGRIETEIDDLARERVYEVYGDGKELVVEEWDRTAAMARSCAGALECEAPDEDAPAAAGMRSGGGGCAPRGDGTDKTVDLLVAYDRGAAQWVRSPGE